ncbi:hypothetical protein ES703_06271 [subsurface metagenome]
MKQPKRTMILKRVGLAILFVCLILAPVMIRDSYILHILIIVGVNIMLAVSLRLILTIGEMSIAHMAFAAIGGYTSALLVMKLDLSTWLALPLASLMGALAAVVIGFICLRLKGFYFALITLAFGEVIIIIITQWRSLLGGYGGIGGIPRPDAIFGLEFGSKTSYYYLILILVVITIAVLYRLEKSRVGKIFKAISRSDLLSESIGINVTGYKILAFSIACFFAAAAGSFQAHYYTVVAPGFFSLWGSIYCIIFVQVGGVGSIVGPILGAAFLTIIPESLRAAPEFYPVIYGTILIVAIMLLPKGLISMPKQVGKVVINVRKRLHTGRGGYSL